MKASPKGEEQAVDISELTPEEANRIIHSRRKVRYGTACWPCRQRKVKCDNKQPCENCVRREHAQLCSYKPTRSSSSQKNASDGDRTSGRKRTRSPSESPRTSRLDQNLSNWPRSIELSANCGEDSDSAADRYVGHNSIPALLREQTSPQGDKRENANIRHEMKSILGLDNSAPFPLMSSSHLQKMTHDIAMDLPSDREVMKLFRAYKETPQPFWGFVTDIDDFESKLMVYLENRSRRAGSTDRPTKPVTAAWLAILFGVLAVGAQYHESPYHVRTRESQRYIQVSFHFLRLSNFLLRPSFDSIQALLLTSFVLLNDMKAEGSWALTGLTCRLAQSLGLHRSNTRDGQSASAEAKGKDFIRRRLWWTCVWHDTLTSLSFDRSPMTNFPSCPIPTLQPADEANFTYLETMYHLIEIISRRLNPDIVASSSYDEIIANCEVIESLRRQACPHIQDKDKCKSALDRLQHYAIRLHTSFVISVACRPALHHDCTFDTQQKAALSEKCKFNLTETVRMFLSMHQLSVIPTRSWAFTYHGLSSALLLGILCETKADPEVRQLQGDLIAALSATASRDSPSLDRVTPQSDRDIELSGPLLRALTALKNIYDHGSVVGTGRKTDARRAASAETRTGTQTPLPPYSQISQMLPSTLLRQSSSGDPREDAAMAMAQMQNGGASISEFPGIPYAATDIPLDLSIESLSATNEVDSVQYMAPMDLYDSIWGESPDPWNSVDTLNFDFFGNSTVGQAQHQFHF